jgi:arsenate reductase-like glutaredoxin family protein
MRAEPSVIKRPVVRWPDGRLTLGFSAEAFEKSALSAPNKG